MRRIILVLFVSLLAPALFAQGTKALDEAWLKAVKAGDAEALTKLYAPDAVTYMPDEMGAKGTAEIRESFKDMTLTYDYTATSGNLSVSSGHFSMTVEPKSGGAAQTMEGRFTSVAAKKGGKWMYVSDHASVPMPPPAAEAKPAS
jgi:ketosteroid isomerase-like protein